MVKVNGMHKKSVLVNIKYLSTIAFILIFFGQVNLEWY
jgi:hypothetical protein